MDQIKISNIAISFCGGNPIMSFEDNTVESNACSVNYEPARDFCLENRDWTFASTRKRLTPLAGAPVSEFSHAFKVPSDCLTVRQVSDNEDMKTAVTYQMDGRNILCDSSIIYIRYTARITDPNLFSPSFSLAVAHKLAELIVVILTADLNMKQHYDLNTERLMDQGGAINGMQGSPKRAYASRLLRARYGASGMGQAIYDWGY